MPAGGNPQYYVEDFLGSSRTVTSSTGVPCYDADFTPFGSELTYTNNCPTQNNYKFGGKERDTETQNDDFGARYYTWRFGRWLSADWSAVPVPVPYANLLNPQTLNLYSMVADDPETFADLDGHDIAAWINTICPLGFCGFNGSGNGRVNQNPSAVQADGQVVAEEKKGKGQKPEQEGKDKDSLKCKNTNCTKIQERVVVRAPQPPKPPRPSYLVLLGSMAIATCAVAEPCGLGELLLGGAMLASLAVAAMDAPIHFSRGGGNRAQNREFAEAVRRIERQLGRELSDSERERLHREISKGGYTLDEIVQIGVALLGGR